MTERNRADFGGGSVLLAACALAAALACLPTGCSEQRAASSDTTDASECTACHGDPHRGGTALRRAAPPVDTLGASDPRYPGVGAHSIHLDASGTHGAVACDECHVVPAHTESPGHIDHPPPATIAFGTIASEGDRTPKYDFSSRTCRDTYCHGGARVVWTDARAPGATCGTCHGLPPALPHPQSDRCFECHGDVIDASGRFLRPELHVNGAVEQGKASCVGCHGSGDQPAPPIDTHGNSASSAIGVGAHRAHLSGGSASRPLDCSECHAVPVLAGDPGHIEGLPARVSLTGIAATEKRAPAWDHASATCADTWCHGPQGTPSASPVWTVPGPLECTSCHGAPPPAPHPQLSDCSLCHGAVVAPDNRTIVDRMHHVDGNVDVSVPSSCTACHGKGSDPTPVAPQPGAGAHHAHLSSDGTARAVPCGECHHVPKTTLDPGHLDTGLPPSVIFSGVAAGGSPAFDGKSCANTECHGAAFADGNPSGGSLTTPTWNVVDGSQDSCGTCHSLPPPAPHPYGSLNPKCNACHGDIADDNRTFTHPELHVDGVVTFTVP